MDPFVSQLAELSKARVTRAKWVFVPSHAVGRTLGKRGIDPSEDGLGLALVMRLLLEIRTSGEAPQAGPGSEQPHFVLAQKHLSRESAPRKAGQPRSEPPANGASGAYFHPLADQPTMAQALWTTIPGATVPRRLDSARVARLPTGSASDLLRMRRDPSRCHPHG